MIKTVLRNRTNNAIKFTPTRGTITLSNCIMYDKTQKLIVSVKDAGWGMSKEVLISIFSISKQHSFLGTENKRGDGLVLRAQKAQTVHSISPYQ